MSNDCPKHPNSGMLIKCDACDAEQKAEQAEQIAALKDGIVHEQHLKALARHAQVKAQDEVKRLKECAELGLEANADKAKEIARLKEENHELLLADTKNTEICEKFEAQLIQANLDIIRLEKRNEDIQ